MSFDFSSLITDRTQADVSRVEQLAAKIKAGTASESELAEFNSAAMKGAYNYTDLNRVTAAMDALKAKLEGYGYNVPGYQRIKIEHNPPPVPVVPGESRLPEKYIELSYIESTGTQYIDTGFKHNQDTRVVMDVQATSLTANAWAFEGRSTTTTAKHGIFFFYSDTKQWTTDYSNTGRKAFSEVGSMDRLRIDYNKNVCTINGQTITHTANTFQSECNLALLADSRSTGFSGFLKAKLYSCQVYDNGTLIRDFVPCIDPSGNIGLFDVVNLQFYESVGSGSFVAGDEVATASVSDVPDGATEYDPYTWYAFDWPTPATMALYLQNVSVIRSILTVMATTPEVPANMATLMVQDANDIEAIVLDVYRQLTIMQTTFIPCGGALCGGDNL